MQPLRPRDNSDDDGTHNPSTKITDEGTNDAQSGSKEGVHTLNRMGTTFGPLLPLGEQQVVIGNPGIQKQLRYLERQFYEVKNKMEVLESKVKAINVEMKPTNDKVSTATEMLDQANANLKTWNSICLTRIIRLTLLVLKLKTLLEPPLADGSSFRPLKGSRDMEVILQQMTSKPTLDNAVCIVSFDANSLDEYKRMIRETVGQLGGVSFRTHVIRKHADISKLPHCRLYIMCVEFTERLVIIEEQGLGLGGLKLTLYRGVRKLGGALVILYIHDPGSRNLSDDQLYSDGVYCVKKQHELKELCEIDRFISAHKKLNTAQKKALETAISNVLNIQAGRYQLMYLPKPVRTVIQ